MIKLEGVYKNYGAIRVLEAMDLQVEEGKPLCLLGRSGCGKSTLLKLVALITRPDKGILTIDGKDVTKISDPEMDELRREKVSYT